MHASHIEKMGQLVSNIIPNQEYHNTFTDHKRLSLYVLLNCMCFTYFLIIVVSICSKIILFFFVLLKSKYASIFYDPHKRRRYMTDSWHIKTKQPICHERLINKLFVIFCYICRINFCYKKQTNKQTKMC